MTHDHVEDFIEKMSKENVPFLVMIPHGKAEVGFRIICNCRQSDTFEGQDELIEHIHEYFDEWKKELED